MSTRLAIAEEVGSLANRGYDWNGTGGLPMREDVRDMTITLLGTVPDRATDVIDQCPHPDILLNGDGTVELAFDHEDKTLLITVRCLGILTYVRAFEDEQTSIEGVIRLDPDEPDWDSYVELTELFAWLSEE